MGTSLYSIAAQEAGHKTITPIPHKTHSRIEEEIALQKLLNQLKIIKNKKAITRFLQMSQKAESWD